MNIGLIAQSSRPCFLIVTASYTWFLRVRNTYLSRGILLTSPAAAIHNARAHSTWASPSGGNRRDRRQTNRGPGWHPSRTLVKSRNPSFEFEIKSAVCVLLINIQIQRLQPNIFNKEAASKTHNIVISPTTTKKIPRPSGLYAITLIPSF